MNTLTNPLGGGAVVTALGLIAAHLSFPEGISNVGAVLSFTGLAAGVWVTVRHKRTIATLEELEAQLRICRECIIDTPLNGLCPFAESNQPRDCPKRKPMSDTAAAKA
jgi:hypothetical protein